MHAKSLYSTNKQRWVICKGLSPLSLFYLSPFFQANIELMHCINKAKNYNGSFLTTFNKLLLKFIQFQRNTNLQEAESM